MKYKIVTRMLKGALLALLAVTLTAGPSLAATYDLCASDGTVTIGGEVIPIWGYADITGGGTCTTGLAILPGPVLTDVAGATLTINLHNSLSVPVSVFIPGLAKPVSPEMQGDRLYSLDATVPAGGTVSYSWTATEGTYLYQSGTDIRTQVPMGLYGALVVSGAGYPAVAQEEVLVYSEIDPALNADPAGFGGARVSSWNPQYFLINGASYPVTPALNINVSEDVLLRFVNAGLQTFVPTLNGLYMEVIAEDGNQYPYPLTQYGIELQAGKTIDAVINAGAAGTYALYDRAGHLANGGLVVDIQAGAAAGAPIAADDAYATEEDTLLSVAAPGVLDNDTAGTGPGPMTASLVSDVSAGLLALAADGSFSYTPNADFSGVDMFTYVANDGGPNSNVATVTITVTPVNDGPVAADDAYDAVEGQILNVAAPGVLANDTDVDGDALTVNTTPVVDPPVGAILVLNADGSFDYTPAGIAGAIETFDYEACDPSPLCSTATVTITVTAATVNIPPFANDDFAETTRNTAITINVVANDVDPDGTIDPTTVVLTSSITQRGGTVVNNGDGTVTFTPKRGFRGTDLFMYTVNDNDSATSNEATVRVNVVR